MLEELKERVYKENLRLVKSGLVILTWGNVSGIDRKHNLVVIKPSGVPYDKMRVSDMAVVDLNGNVVEGDLKPSSDLLTHLELYKHFPNINGVVHTHSSNAVAFAQAGRNLPSYGTTHADTFYGDVPCTRKLTKNEIEEAYELNTGKVIVETFINKDYVSIPAVLVNNHGPFTWGETPEQAVENAIILEEVCRMAIKTESLNPSIKGINQYILDKHYLRKHGKNAYYGQKEHK